MSNPSVNDLAHALDQLQTVLSAVTPSRLDDATPCEKWNVKELASHIVGGTLMFGAITRGETPVEANEGSDLTLGEIVSTFDAARKSLLAAWQEPGVFDREMVFPFASLPAEVGARVQLMEVVVHTWDLAEATDQVESLDSSLAENVLAYAGAMIPESSRNPGG